MFKDITAINGFYLALAISMLVIGDRYNKEDLCRLDAPYCMLVIGGLTLGLAIGDVLYLLFTSGCILLVGSGYGIWFAAMGYIGIYLANFGGLIWATLRVFSSYNEWTYEDKKSETYCEYTPFVFAMVILIVNWIYLCLEVSQELLSQRIDNTNRGQIGRVSFMTNTTTNGPQNQEGTVELITNFSLITIP